MHYSLLSQLLLTHSHIVVLASFLSHPVNLYTSSTTACNNWSFNTALSGYLILPTGFPSHTIATGHVKHVLLVWLWQVPQFTPRWCVSFTTAHVNCSFMCDLDRFPDSPQGDMCRSLLPMLIHPLCVTWTSCLIHPEVGGVIHYCPC